jgi:hypothetical protein
MRLRMLIVHSESETDEPGRMDLFIFYLIYLIFVVTDYAWTSLLTCTLHTKDIRTALLHYYIHTCPLAFLSLPISRYLHISGRVYF